MLTYILLRLVYGVYFSLVAILWFIQVGRLYELWYSGLKLGVADIGYIARDLFLALLWPFLLVTSRGRCWLVDAFHL